MDLSDDVTRSIVRFFCCAGASREYDQMQFTVVNKLVIIGPRWLA